MERTLAPISPLHEAAEFEPDRPRAVPAHLDQAVEQVISGDYSERPKRASALNKRIAAMAKRNPSARTRDLIVALLADHRLAERFDETGESCRAALIKAQLSLGFPYALEVDPDDLAYLRSTARRPGSLAARIALGISGALSLIWNAGWALLLLISLARSRGELALAALAAPFVVATVHALFALVACHAAGKADDETEYRRVRKTLITLGWMMLIGPAASLIAALCVHPREASKFFALGMAWALPAMLTAVFAAVTAGTVPKPE